MRWGQLANEMNSFCFLMVMLANPFWVATGFMFPTDETTIVMRMMLSTPGMLIAYALAWRFTPTGGFSPKQWCWAVVACIGMVIATSVIATLVERLLHLG